MTHYHVYKGDQMTKIPDEIYQYFFCKTCLLFPEQLPVHLGKHVSQGHPSQPFKMALWVPTCHVACAWKR